MDIMSAIFFSIYESLGTPGDHDIFQSDFIPHIFSNLIKWYFTCIEMVFYDGLIKISFWNHEKVDVLLISISFGYIT